MVVIGKVKFVFIDNNKIDEIIIGSNNNKSIFIPPKIFYGFMGIEEKT